ncbi:galactose oxidase, central domain-containing protein [Ditylenchus destructor]|nr:galactose oxidase, central domain-containing protein [Ditylenchus destructor]
MGDSESLVHMQKQNSQEHNDQSETIMGVEDLSDYVLELIFTSANLYKDLDNLRLVNKRWYRVGNTALTRMKRLFYQKCNNFSWRLIDDDAAGHSHLLSERCSHAACYHPRDQAMYMFGGCTSTYTAFNDLWMFNLSTREWSRVLISRPPLPSAKALASLVLYNDNLILYGGFSKSSMNPIHQTTTFYKEIHLYNRCRNCWEEIVCENTAPHLAGHSASIVGDFMLVFGGSMGSSYNNNVYVLDITRRIWNMPSIPGPCPPPRYGQSHILLDARHLIIIGGCGGPNVMLNDVWLLDFDLEGDTEWRWTQLKVEGLDLTPPYMWCHRACKVGQNAVVLSRPTKYNVKRTKRRRASSQSTTNSGCHRISSPDSPQDRRAVAAAFCSSTLTRGDSNGENNFRPSGHSDDITSKRKPLLLSSRSLDEQDKKNSPQNRPPQHSLQVHNTNSLSSCATGSNANPIPSKSSELHRACSIPAIIVGEIPKLIVTSSNDPQQGHSNQQKPSLASGLVVVDDGKFFDGGKNPSTSAYGNSFSSSTSVFEDSPSSSLNDSMDQPDYNEFRTSKSSSHTDAVRDYYLSLLKEEYNRLRIVELAENLIRIDEKLDTFLSERVPYLTAPERLDMIDEFLGSQEINLDGDSPLLHRRQGQLSSRKNQRLSMEDSARNSLDSNSSSSRRPSLNESTGNIFGQTYYRHMCVYVLRLERAIEEHVVRWEQLAVEDDAPEDVILHSLVAARGELIFFGGMRNDGGGTTDCLNAGMDRHMMSADTYILRPRYSDLL